jgi:hypothetical protein
MAAESTGGQPPETSGAGEPPPISDQTPPSGTPPPAQPTPAPPIPPPGDDDEEQEAHDEAAAGAKVEATVEWELRDPYIIADKGGIQQIEDTIIEKLQTIMREYASFMEIKPLMSKRFDIAKRLAECFTCEDRRGDNERNKHIPKHWTVVIGILFTIFMTALPHKISSGTQAILWSLFWLGVGVGGFQKIKLANQGVLTILGTRYRIIADEGNQWALWLLTGFTTYQTHGRLTKLEGDKAFTVTAGIAENAGKEIPVFDIDVDKDFFGKVVRIKKILLPNISPTNPELMRAYEGIEIERARSVMQDLDMERLSKRVKKLMALHPGKLTDERAWQIVEAQENLLLRHQYMMTGNAQAGSAIPAVLPLVSAIDEQRQQGQGKRPPRRNQGGGQ